MANAMFAAFAVILWIGVAIKCVQLARAPEDRPLRTVAAGLASAAIAFTVGREFIEVPLDAAVPGLVNLIQNLAMIGAFYSLMAFFVHTASTHAQREMRLHHVVEGFLVVIMLGAWSVAPAEVRADMHANSGDGSAVVYFVCSALAMLYSLFHAARHTISLSRRARRPRLRRGLAILSVGLISAAGTNVLSLVMALASGYAGYRTELVDQLTGAYLVMALIAVPALAVGLSWPIVAAMIASAPIWRAHWNDYQNLKPLRRQIYQAFPTTRLQRTRGAKRPWSIHARRVRSGLEIRDGIVLLAPYYPVLSVSTGYGNGHRQLTMEDRKSVV